MQIWKNSKCAPDENFVAILAFAERLPTSATLIVTIFEMSFWKVKTSQGKLQMALSWHKKYFSGKLVSKNFLMLDSQDSGVLPGVQFQTSETVLIRYAD